MKTRGYVALVAIGVAASWASVHSAEASPFNPASPLAQKKGKGKGKAKPGKPKVGRTAKPIQMAPKGLTWGMANIQVARLYDNYFENMYGQMLKKTPLGPQTEALTAELEDRKDLIRRNLLEFGNQKTGVDSTPLKGEYSYANNESMSKTTLNGGITRYFFYFNDQLWKVYDEHNLKAGAPLGVDYASAVTTLTTMFGSEPKKLEAGAGATFDEARWSDGTTLVRLINREHENIGVIAYVDESIQNKLPSLRKNRMREEHMSRDVTDATTKAPPPQEDKGKKKKKK